MAKAEGLSLKDIEFTYIPFVPGPATGSPSDCQLSARDQLVKA